MIFCKICWNLVHYYQPFGQVSKYNANVDTMAGGSVSVCERVLYVYVIDGVDVYFFVWRGSV